MSDADSVEKNFRAESPAGIDPLELLSRRRLRFDPHHAAALHLLGLAAYRQRQYAVALDYLQRAVAREGSNPEYLRSLGQVYSVLERWDDAAESFERALVLVPGRAEAHLDFGKALLGLGNEMGARVHLHLAAHLQPDLREAWDLLAALDGDEAEAISAPRRA